MSISNSVGFCVAFEPKLILNSKEVCNYTIISSCDELLVAKNSWIFQTKIGKFGNLVPKTLARVFSPKDHCHIFEFGVSFGEVCPL